MRPLCGKTHGENRKERLRSYVRFPSLGQRPNVPPLKLKLVCGTNNQLCGLRRICLRVCARLRFPLAHRFLCGLFRLGAHLAHQLVKRSHPRQVGGDHVRHAARVQQCPICLRAVALKAEVFFDVQEP